MQTYSIVILAIFAGFGLLELWRTQLFSKSEQTRDDGIVEIVSMAALTIFTQPMILFLSAGLMALGFSVAASQTNFVLAQTPKNVSAFQLYQALKDKGILVRYFNTPRLQDALRITVGTPEQNHLLLDQLNKLIGD